MFTNFKIDPQSAEHLRRIIDRHVEHIDKSCDRTATSMDLIATHNGGCPLDFERMASVADEHLWHVAHDIAGIARFLDRDTGELTGCFLPRFHLPLGQALQPQL